MLSISTFYRAVDIHGALLAENNFLEIYFLQLPLCQTSHIYCLKTIYEQ